MMPSPRHLAPALLLALPLAACGSPGGGDGTGGLPDADVSLPDDDGGAPAAASCDRIDLLFVVDDSTSMEQEQANLAANFPGFVAVLDQLTSSTGAPIDYRIGITTTGRDLTLVSPLPTGPTVTQAGADGALIERADCGMTRPWIERADPDVAGTFACAAQVGTDGPTVEMPLLMADWAFTDRVADGANAGFLRPDALLAIVVLTDEDDCSQTGADVPAADVWVCDTTRPDIVAPAAVATVLDGVAGARGRWAIAAIAGQGPLPCDSAFGRAQPANRVAELVGLAGDNGVLASICEGDLASPLATALDTFAAACAAFPEVD